uniref:Uncharacterized protein n=1 Tax=Solanum tuberosum TaxID=4113 RepID=M1B3D9_SOLTU
MVSKFEFELSFMDICGREHTYTFPFSLTNEILSIFLSNFFPYSCTQCISPIVRYFCNRNESEGFDQKVFYDFFFL